jgi:halimadienyl-diphosphate synthase
MTWIDVDAAGRDLLTGLVDSPWGQVSPSPYETGRLVTTAPWLAGHPARIDYLVGGQRPDGGWGGPEGYALVPTLSATDALLAVATDPGIAAGVDPGPAAAAAHRGLSHLRRWLDRATGSLLPDMPAIELIVPALVESINARLAAADRPTGRRDEPRFAGGSAAALRLPVGLSPEWSGAVRALVAAGGPIDTKLAHALEVAGPAARGSQTVQPATTGSIGASAAATAAWLGPNQPAADHPARRFLETAAQHTGGPVPCALPITAFERAWVLGTLCRGDLMPGVPAEIMAGLRAAGESATPTSPGLPPDADTTSATLFALAVLGRPGRFETLIPFETSTHFSTWPGERGMSSSVNAHVLEAVGATVDTGAPVSARQLLILDTLSYWLVDQQQADGYWVDRWHASPYYATMSCAVALSQYGRPTCARAIRRAVVWILANQRHDGSWGRWGGTVEETAYALQTLLLTSAVPPHQVDEAVHRGHAYLLAAGSDLVHLSAGRGASSRRGRSDTDPVTFPTPELPALWHDKDLYLPHAVVRAAVLVALHLAQSRRVAPVVRQGPRSA